MSVIAQLDPIPARDYVLEKPTYIVPDVYIFKVGGQWLVGLNEEGLPRLMVSDLYRTMVDGNEKTSQEDKNYITEKVRAADWLIRSIHQRQKTIFQVTETILKRQMEFFEKGINFLKPMILRDIADDLNLSESTVSRVTSNKYVHTPRGIFELKYFFNSGVSTASGEDVASEAVKQKIVQLVKGEPSDKPYSDQALVELLAKEGVQVARRTVAKYREQCNILPSSRRKKLY